MCPGEVGGPRKVRQPLSLRLVCRPFLKVSSAQPPGYDEVGMGLNYTTVACRRRMPAAEWLIGD